MNKEHMASTTDPLVGTQEHTDSLREAMAAPPEEMVMEEEPVGMAEKSRTVAGWLGIFLGWLGVHRFYLGFNRVGAFQAALSLGCTALLVVIVLWLTPEISWGHFVMGILSVVMLFVMWGFAEGVAILSGMLPYDARHHPLRP